jgi:hypothetical protein
VFSSWFEIQFLQLFPHLAHLIRLGFSAGAWLQVQKTRSAPKYYVAAFRFPRGVPELRKQRAEVIEEKVRVVSTSRQLVEQFLRPAHAPRMPLTQRPLQQKMALEMSLSSQYHRGLWTK